MPREGRRSSGTTSQETCFALSTFFLAGVCRVLRRVFTGVPYMFNARTKSLVLIVMAAAAMRLLPHPPNMTSITALALFGGATFADRRLAFAVPLLAMLVSDFALGLYGHMEVQYLAVVGVVALGLALRQHRNAGRIAAATLGGSVLFYLVTNFGVWAFEPMYPKTLAGLAASYVAAIPFFGNSLVGDLGFALVLFGGMRLLELRFSALREPQALTA
jgi:hypothetical protein